MKHALPICLFALALPFAGAAVAEQPPKGVDAGEDLERLPAQLDSFVQDAIDQGLLQPSLPAGTGPEKTVRRLTPEPEPAPAAAPAIQPESEPEAAPVKVSLRPRQGQESPQSCGVSFPYEFSDFAAIRTYQDMMSWRGVLETENTAASNVLLAKGYLALGMNEESRAQLAGRSDRMAVALRELAWLMEGRTYPNLSYFEELSECHDSAQIWHAFALIRVGEASGVQILSTHLEDFKSLPFEIRTTYARMVVPTLDRMKEVEIARQLLLTFSDEDINSYQRLRFPAAIVGFSLGAEGSEDQLRHFLKLVGYSDEAAAVLRRAGLDVDADFESEYIDRLVDQFGHLPDDIPVEASLDVLLGDLNTSADYAMTRQLASVPPAQTAEAKAKLADHYMELIKADLESTDKLANLKGMDALLNSSDLLAGRDDLEETYSKAAAIAAHLGLKTMSDKLSGRVSSDEALAVSRANLAFRLGEHDQVSALQKSFPDNREILTLAALDAVRSGDAAGFAHLERKLELTADLALALVAADGMGRHWILPDRYFTAALDVEGADKQAQLQRIIAARPAGATSSAASPALTLADVPAGLDRIGQSLQPDAMEMR
ncbi:MAG: hypothetical protein RLN72_06195 [Henriciella sp.]